MARPASQPADNGTDMGATREATTAGREQGERRQRLAGIEGRGRGRTRGTSMSTWYLGLYPGSQARSANGERLGTSLRVLVGVCGCWGVNLCVEVVSRTDDSVGTRRFFPTAPYEYPLCPWPWLDAEISFRHESYRIRRVCRTRGTRRSKNRT